MTSSNAPRQIEIQLGHLCNNRCVFCVSGQETALGNARVLETETILAQVRGAHAAGHRKLTILGGEPTLQPGFLEVVREAARLDFEEIVVFTNGAKTARAAFVDEILATGGRITWRISLQGATREAHERTTKKPGSFARIERTLENLAARRQTITINMCVVQSNYESVSEFPALLRRYAPHVTQLHLDMMRPLDAGKRSDDELRATLPRYADLARPFARMIAGLPRGFDVNLGNVPACIAPELSRWIHHDGEPTATISVDGGGALSKPWNKYLVKARDKVKLSTCASCAFEPTCSGVYETYLRLSPHFAADLRPVPRDLPPTVATRLHALRRSAPFDPLVWREVRHGERTEIVLDAPDGSVARVWLGETNGVASGGYAVDGNATDDVRRGLSSVMRALGLLSTPGEAAAVRPNRADPARAARD